MFFNFIFIHFIIIHFAGIRSSYSDPASQYIVILFTVLFFKKDYRMASETFLIDYFVISIAFKKICEFLLKVRTALFRVFGIRQNRSVNNFIYFISFACFSYNSLSPTLRHGK